MDSGLDKWVFDRLEKLYMQFVGFRKAFIRVLITRLFLAFLLIALAFAVYYVGYLNEHGSPINLSVVLSDFYTNLSSELIGIVITVILVDVLAAVRQQHNERDNLVLQVASPINMFAVEAIRILDNKGWHRDGTLWHKNLHNANLANANLREFDFRGSILDRADLSDTDLSATNFRRSGLRSVNFKNAYMVGTALLGADLSHANLEGATLVEVHFDNDTILPDGSSWTRDTDMARFCDPNHSDFWRSPSSISPASPKAV